MKLKNWCSAVLMIIATLSIMSVFIVDNVWCNIAAVAVELICVAILTKYSKICD